MHNSAALWVSLLPLLGSCAVLDLPISFTNTYALAEVEVGSPAQSHSLFFDTGSGSIWMLSDDCTPSSCSNPVGYNRHPYNQSESSTAVELGTESQIVYSGGTVQGFAAADLFSVSGLSWNQTFIAANKSTWVNNPADGFLGLGFPILAAPGTETAPQTLLDDGLLDEPRFAIYYGKEFNNTIETSTQGVLTIGGSEEEKYVDGNLTWIEPLRLYDTGEALEYVGWRVNMTAWSGQYAGSGTSGSTTNTIENGECLFDTGGGPITVPTSLVYDLYESIGMNYTAILKGYRPLCSDFTSDWSITFYFGDEENPTAFTLTGDQLASPGFPDGKSKVNCWPPFNSGNSDGFFLFGTRFMHNIYSVFDFGGTDSADFKPRIGFGTLKEEYRAY